MALTAFLYKISPSILKWITEVNILFCGTYYIYMSIWFLFLFCVWKLLDILYIDELLSNAKLVSAFLTLLIHKYFKYKTFSSILGYIWNTKKSRNSQSNVVQQELWIRGLILSFQRASLSIFVRWMEFFPSSCVNGGVSLSTVPYIVPENSHAAHTLQVLMPQTVVVRKQTTKQTGGHEHAGREKILWLSVKHLKSHHCESGASIVYGCLENAKKFITNNKMS